MLASEASAQQPNAVRLRRADDTVSGHMSLGELTPTPSMWFYEQERRDYLDPELAVRRKSEQRAADRASRISAMKWYGYSNSRPQANPTPFSGGRYSAHWVGNVYRDGSAWSGAGTPVIIYKAQLPEYPMH